MESGTMEPTLMTAVGASDTLEQPVSSSLLETPPPPTIASTSQTLDDEPTPLISSVSPGPTEDKGSTTADLVPEPPKHKYTFPPFPSLPSTSTPLVPFSKFKEHGIRIFADPETGVELDGLGFPTVRLRVGHGTDTRKTDGKVAEFKGESIERIGDAEAGGEGDGEGEGEELGGASGKRKRKKKKNGADGDEANRQSTNRNQKNVKLPIDLSKIKDPVERALEEKKQRIKLFSNQEWWVQWGAGEDLRRGRTYDPSLTPIDRVHMAATDFRTGRIWPPASSNVRFLWDQFRLYVGLLGSPPVWKRMDVPISENRKSSSVSDKGPSVSNSRTSTSTTTARKSESDSSDDEILHAKYSDEEEEPEEGGEEEGAVKGRKKGKPTTSQQKRVPLRAPYALFHPPKTGLAANVTDEDEDEDDEESKDSSSTGSSHLTPIPIFKASQLPLLLSLSKTLRQTRLLNFLAEPATFVAEFLSSYTYTQGLVWGSPSRMVGIGRLVIFWLEFMKRCGVISGLNLGSSSRESRYKDNHAERQLVKAIEIGQKAVVEIPRAGWVVRMSPEEKGGKGCRSLWGTRWKDAGTPAFMVKEEEEDEFEIRLRKFEEQLRAENIQLFTADPVKLGVPPLHRERDEDEEPIVIEKKEDKQKEKAKEKATRDDGPDSIYSYPNDVTRLSLLPPLPPPPISTNWARPLEEDDDDQEKQTASPKSPETSPWAVPPEQTLFNLLGSMSVFPLLHTAGGWDAHVGCAEKSVRRVKAVYAPGAGGIYGADIDGRKPTAVEESLMSVFARVVLEPWADWEDMNMASEYKTPKLCGPNEISAVEKNLREDIDREEKEKEKEKDQEDQNTEEAKTELEKRVARRLERIETDRKRYAHNVGVDDITLLVEPRLAEGLSVGMGMLGTWVQIVPIPPPLSPLAGSTSRFGHGTRGRGRGRGRGKGRGRGGVPAETTGHVDSDTPTPPPHVPKREPTFWYIEEIHMVVPSFWAVPRKGVPGWSLLAEHEELRKMFDEAVEAGDDDVGVLDVEDEDFGI